MTNMIIAQAYGNSTMNTVIGYIVVGYAIFFLHLYIFRAVFNIPSFLRYQKAQIKLLKELAKVQGVDDTKVQGIISETYGWGETPSSNAPTTKTA